MATTLVFLSFWAAACAGTPLPAAPVPAGSDPPWVQRFTPVRELVVSPEGGARSATEMSLEAAIQTAEPGDLFWLREGIYRGHFLLARNGTAEHPIVFRARPGERATILGSIDVSGAHTWVWGLEITDPAGLSRGASGVDLHAPGSHAINNVIHHQFDKNGIGAWETGAGQVVYGNIVYENGQGPHHPHNLYAQNDFARHGYKYIVDNLLLDAADVCDGCFNLHAYTEQGLITGLFLRGNVIKNGRFLIGGFNEPAQGEVVVESYFYRCHVQFGYRRPTQTEFRDNYLARSGLSLEWFWGAGEVRYQQAEPNVFTGNEILLPPDVHIRLRTSAYLPEGRCEGCPPIQATDQFDRNRYSLPFAATLFANNEDFGELDFAEWQQGTRAAGRTFDTSSELVGEPSGSKIALIPNAYETGRGHLAIFNWNGSPEVAVDLSPTIPPGTPFEVRSAKDPFGEPVASGVYQGPVMIPTGGDEFSAFLVLSRQEPRP